MKLRSVAPDGTGIKSIDVTLKSLREILRDRRGFVFLLGLPVLLIVLFAFAFGSGTFLSGGSLPHEIAVINNDAGVNLALNNTTNYMNYGANFTDVLENATAENSTTHLFHLNNVSMEKAEDMLKSRNIDALIIIPQNFSGAFAAMMNNSTRTVITSSVGQQAIANAPTISAAINASIAGFNTEPIIVPGANVTLPTVNNTTAALFIQGDTGFVNFATAQALIGGILDQYKNDVLKSATGSVSSDYIPAELVPIAGTKSFSLFDYMVPGLIVFALLLQVSIIASSLARDAEKGLLNRLKLSKMRAFDLLFGTFLTWTLITVAQIIILIAIAIALGYKYQGDLSSLGLATLIGVIAGMASISLALIIASFTKNEQQAIGLSAMLSVPLGFMAGAFIPLPRQVLAESGGRTYMLYDVLPWTHAVSSLRSVLTYGTGLSADVIFQMFWLIVLTAILFFVGVATYSVVRLRAEK
ncbi:MAG: ABC transporter permease [Halobacteriota archaeon]